MTTDRVVVRRAAPYRFASVLGIVLALLGGFLHYSLRDPLPMQTANVVAYLETAGPFWPTAFGLAALAVVTTTAVRRGRSVALVLTAGVFAAYAVALGYTAVSTGSGWVTACLSVGLAVQALSVSATYAEG